MIFESPETALPVDSAKENSGDAKITIDSSARVVLFNPAAEKVFGCCAEEAIGSSIDRFVPQRFRQLYREYLRQFQHSGLGAPSMGKLGLLLALRADGEEFPIEATVIQSECGGEKYFEFAVRELTEHLRIRETLRRIEEDARNFLLQAPVATVITRAPGWKCEFANDQFTKLFGYTKEDVPDLEHWWPIAYPDEAYRAKVQAEWVARLQRTDLDGEMEPIEAFVRCKDGSTRYVQFQFATAGNAYLLSLVDLTEHHRLELEGREQRFREMADAAPVMIWTSEADMSNSFVNKRWLEFTGRSQEEERGTGWVENVFDEDRLRCLNTLTKAYERREQFCMEYRVRRYDGEYRWIYDSGAPRYGSDGEFAGYIGYCIDVSERKVVESVLSTFGQRLIQAQEEERARIARELHDDVGQRLALIAIGLKNAQASMLESNQTPTENLALDQVNKVVKQVNELAQDVHSLSHKLHSSYLDQLGLVTAAQGMCREISDRQNVQVDFRSENVPRKLSKDVTLTLFRVMQAALQNAVKHSDSRIIQVALVGTSSEIKLSVHDSGVGFNLNQAEKGTGMGLLSMRERLKSVQGKLSIQTKPLGGTTICACVPLVTNSSPLG